MPGTKGPTETRCSVGPFHVHSRGHHPFTGWCPLPSAPEVLPLTLQISRSKSVWCGGMPRNIPPHQRFPVVAVSLYRIVLPAGGLHRLIRTGSMGSCNSVYPVGGNMEGSPHCCSFCGYSIHQSPAGSQWNECFGIAALAHAYPSDSALQVSGIRTGSLPRCPCPAPYRHRYRLPRSSCGIPRFHPWRWPAAS
jgi:hypothetical protein